MAIRSLKNNTFSRSALAGNPLIMPGSYDSIASTTLSSTTASVTFSSIPSTYSHLQIRISSRSSFAFASMFDSYLAFNGDNTYSGYKDHILYGNGASPTTVTASSYNLSYTTPGPTQTASVYNGVVIDILDYANTNKYKVAKFLGGADLNGSGNIVVGSILWPNTAAINQITLSCDGSFITGSSFALYGVN